ncbi:MAG TPA: hypothetical protein VFJ63_04255 [Candidatus Bathyarchaeia archaeon]|nr:hypothetical protein [Candidatus Bathyarchaeia archaeon]
METTAQKAVIGMNRVNKWLMKRAMMSLGFEAAKILCILGGLAVLVSGLFPFAISRIALGLIATVISGQVRHMLWSGIIVVLGAFTYYEFGGGGSFWIYGPIMVIAAGIVGVIVHIL